MIFFCNDCGLFLCFYFPFSCLVVLSLHMLIPPWCIRIYLLPGEKNLLGLLFAGYLQEIALRPDRKQVQWRSLIWMDTCFRYLLLSHLRTLDSSQFIIIGAKYYIDTNGITGNFFLFQYFLLRRKNKFKLTLSVENNFKCSSYFQSCVTNTNFKVSQI